jgi:hypothetical protein
MAGSQVNKTIAIDFFQQAVLGYESISLTSYASGGTVPLIAAGGVAEISQELYEFSSDETITGWSGVSNSTKAFIYIVPSGTTCTVIFSTTTPIFNVAKNGWYNGNNRAIYSVYKNSSGNIMGINKLDKQILTKRYEFFYSGDVTTVAESFTALEQILPNIGDFARANLFYGLPETPTLRVITHVTRLSETIIQGYGANISGQGISAFNITRGATGVQADIEGWVEWP